MQCITSSRKKPSVRDTSRNVSRKDKGTLEPQFTTNNSYVLTKENEESKCNKSERTRMDHNAQDQATDGAPQLQVLESSDSWHQSAVVRNSDNEEMLRVTVEPGEGEKAYMNVMHREVRRAGPQTVDPGAMSLPHVNGPDRYEVPDRRCFRPDEISSIPTRHRSRPTAHVPLGWCTPDVLDTNRDLLAQNMDPWPVYKELRDAEVFTSFHGQQLKKTSDQGTVAVNMLLFYFVWRMGSVGFLELVSALNRTSQTRLASMLMKTEKKIRDYFLWARGMGEQQKVNLPAPELVIHRRDPFRHRGEETTAVNRASFSRRANAYPEPPPANSAPSCRENSYPESPPTNSAPSCRENSYPEPPPTNSTPSGRENTYPEPLPTNSAPSCRENTCPEPPPTNPVPSHRDHTYPEPLPMNSVPPQRTSTYSDPPLPAPPPEWHQDQTSPGQLQNRVAELEKRVAILERALLASTAVSQKCSLPPIYFHHTRAR